MPPREETDVVRIRLSEQRNLAEWLRVRSAANFRTPEGEILMILKTQMQADRGHTGGEEPCTSKVQVQTPPPVTRRNVTGFRGVARVGNRFTARYRHQYLGSFATASEAATAWNAVAAGDGVPADQLNVVEGAPEPAPPPVALRLPRCAEDSAAYYAAMKAAGHPRATIEEFLAAVTFGGEKSPIQNHMPIVDHPALLDDDD